MVLPQEFPNTFACFRNENAENTRSVCPNRAPTLSLLCFIAFVFIFHQVCVSLSVDFFAPELFLNFFLLSFLLARIPRKVLVPALRFSVPLVWMIFLFFSIAFPEMAFRTFMPSMGQIVSSSWTSVPPYFRWNLFVELFLVIPRAGIHRLSSERV